MKIRRAFPLVVLYAVVACDGDFVEAKSFNIADYSIAVEAGNNQTGIAGQPLPVNIAALVTLLESGIITRKVSGARVTFTVTSGGGMVTDGGPGGLRTTAEVLTAEAGPASIQWVLGPAAGPQTATARVTGGNAAAVVTFTATATAPVTVASVSFTPDGATVLVGAQASFTTTRRDASSAVTTIGQVNFTTPDPTLIQISAFDANVGTVTVRGLAAGSARLIATAGTRADTAIVQVNAPVAPVATLVLTPATATINVGQTQQMTVETRDAQNNVLTGRAINYSTTNSAVASVSPSGAVLGVTGGVADIIATSETKADTSRITVTPAACAAGAVCTVTISTNNNATTVQVTHTLLFQAILRDQAGNQITTGQNVTYTSSNTAVAVIEPAPAGGPPGYFALIRGVSVGQVTINATANGRTGSVVINVVP